MHGVMVDGGVDGDEVVERKGRYRGGKEGGERRREEGRKRETKANGEWGKRTGRAQWSKYKDSASSSQECC